MHYAGNYVGINVLLHLMLLAINVDFTLSITLDVAVFLTSVKQKKVKKKLKAIKRMNPTFTTN